MFRDVGCCVGRDPLMQHRFVIQAREDGYRWDGIKFEAVELDGVDSTKRRQRFEEALASLRVGRRSRRIRSRHCSLHHLSLRSADALTLS